MTFYRGDPNRLYPPNDSKRPVDYLNYGNSKLGGRVNNSTQYNPEITLYFNNADELLKVKESFQGSVYEQTVSGTNYANHNISYSITYSSWDVVT